MAFDRSKYTGGSRKAQTQVAAKAAKHERKSSGGGRLEYFYIEEGRNVFRIAPPHNPEHSAYEVFRTATLECMKDVWKDGEKSEQQELGNKKIYSALAHHDKLATLGAEGDPIELYVKLAKDIAFETIKDKDERRKFLAPINGFRNPQGKWVWGIEPKSAFMCFAFNEDGALGKLELNKNWVADIDRLAIELEEAGEPIDIDPFSNPVEGYPLVITRSKNEKNKWEYFVEKDIPSRIKKESWEGFFKRTEITDNQLQELDKQTPLNKTFVNCYKLADFEFAIDGLSRFDSKYGFGILDLPEFEDAVAKIRGILEGEVVTGTEEVVEEVVEEVAEEVVEDKGAETPPTLKTAEPVKKVVKKAVKKKVVKSGPTTGEMTIKVSEYLTAVYGEEYLPQIPTDVDELAEWFKITEAEEADGDLELVAVDEFEVDSSEVLEAVEEVAVVEEVEADVPEVVEEVADTDEVEGDEADALRKQMEALRGKKRR